MQKCKETKKQKEDRHVGGVDVQLCVLVGCVKPRSGIVGRYILNPGPGLTPGIFAHTGFTPGFHTGLHPEVFRGSRKSAGVHTWSSGTFTQQKNLRVTRLCEYPD